MADPNVPVPLRPAVIQRQWYVSLLLSNWVTALSLVAIAIILLVRL